MKSIVINLSRTTFQFKIQIFAVSAIILLSTTLSSGQIAATKWNSELNSALKEFQDCRESEQEDCKQIVGRAFKIVYGIDDFQNGTGNSYLTVNEIGTQLNKRSEWKKLGPAYDQKVLNKGQELANENKAVLAVYFNSDGQALHVAMILPGQLKSSGSWGAQVPNSASFFAPEPEKSFVGEPLSYAFEKRMLLHVILYGRTI